MNLQKAKQWMLLFNDKIQKEKDYLSELDTPIGDGDHGGNMARGMIAVVEEITEKEYENENSLFKAVGIQLLSKVGGASGPLYGSAFIGMSQSSSDNIADNIQAGLDMIIKRGKAEVGEKTMVDVWTPVVEHLKAGTLTSEKIDYYVNETSQLKATKGRASYLGERSIGHIDPGSYSSGLLFKSLLEIEVL